MHNPDPSSHSPRFQPAFLGPKVPLILFPILSSPLRHYNTTSAINSTFVRARFPNLASTKTTSIAHTFRDFKVNHNIRRQIGLEAPRALRVSRKLTNFRLIQKNGGLALIYNHQNQTTKSAEHTP